MKDKNHMTISIDAEITFDKNPAPIYDENSQKTGIRGNMPKHNKGCV